MKANQPYKNSSPQLFLGNTSNNKRVFDRPNSHHHLTKDLIAEVLTKVHLVSGGLIKETIDMGRIVGATTCIATDPGDTVMFALRPMRNGYTRFVYGRPSEPCSRVVAIFKKMERLPDAYVLITAFIGNESEPEPWDRHATANSRTYWNNHALVWASEDIVHGSETIECPW
jgi:hypothetical protein